VGAETESGAPHREPAAKPQAGFADVARRMTSRTTDLIAIALVVAASLTFGRQILRWWHAAPPAAGTTGAPAVQLPWEDPLRPVALEFGDLPLSMTRQTVFGNAEAAVEALVRHCERGAAAARAPWRDWDEAERQLLARIEGLTPVAWESGVWQVYVIDRQFPMAAGVRRFVSGENDAAAGHPRLVCWGMAMPAGESAWNLFVFQAAVRGSAAAASLPDVPLPPDGHRNLSVRDERGGLLVGFAGTGLPAEWMHFYDDWFADAGWSSEAGWLTSGGAWSVQFRKPGAHDAGRVEIQFAEGANREMTGLLQIVPHDETQ
jgi:hypothetical protein